MAGPKEAFYDENISPLMDDVIRFCKAQGISMLASFELDTSEDDPDVPLLCTTQIILPDCQSTVLRKAAKVIYPGPTVCLAETIETLPDGSKKVTIARVS